MAHQSNEELLKRTQNTARFFVEHPQVSWVALAVLLLWGVYG
jgi:hypothetical protein